MPEAENLSFVDDAGHVDRNASLLL